MKGKWSSTLTLALLECVIPQVKKKRRLLRLIGTSSGLTFNYKKLKQDTKTNARRRFSGICVIVLNIKGNERMLCCLLDTGCSKSIVLKKFTDKKYRSKLSKEDTVCYTTYERKFLSTETTTLQIKLVEFGEEFFPWIPSGCSRDRREIQHDHWTWHHGRARHRYSL